MADTAQKRREVLARVFSALEDLGALQEDPTALTLSIGFQAIVLATSKHMVPEGDIARLPAVYRDAAADLLAQAETVERAAFEVQPGRRWNAPGVPQGEA